ncbi:hypothetical protein [Microbacterium luticocti]|uniref:hypothetical protein n=1 Tax=Microbacterium luticocti TaxID=451764 RepID=UPI0003FD8C22|nr:hypothetical protein [Microbacterium luticocti]
MPRDLTRHGDENLRDRGGRPSRDGRETLRRRVVRGARRELLTAQRWRDAAAWGLRPRRAAWPRRPQGTP